MESKFQMIVLKIVRHNELDHLRLIVETCSEELDQSESVAGRTLNRPPNSLNPVILKKISAIRDRKYRNICHIAAKYGYLDILNYLLELGFPVDELDRNGNNVVHLLLNHVKKSNEKHKKKKSKRKSDRSEQMGYVQCCKLLEQILGRTNRPLLSTPNHRGIKASDLLQRLWTQATDSDRKIGDEILTRSVAQTSARCSILKPSASGAKYENDSELLYEEDSLADSIESGSENFWEDYFSGFQEQTQRSHLDTIREEYERRKSSTSFAYSNSVPKPSTSSRSTSNRKPDEDRKRQEFHKRHNEALVNKFGQHVAEYRLNFETYSKLWSKFVEKESESIRSLNDIEWPPFSNQDQSEQAQADTITYILSFVHHSMSNLRQLQIDWHPDRFMSRFGSRFDNEQIKEQVSNRVVAISQILNAAVEKLRETGKNSEKS